MSDFLELAARRQSCRDFADKPVEHDKLVKCAEAARLSPSGCNSQPWSLIVVESPDKVKEVAATTQLMGLNKHNDDARAFFVVLEEHAKLMPKMAQLVDSQIFAKGDLGGFVLSLCLEAESQGLGTCILGLFDRPKLRELLGIPDYKPIFLLVSVGYPASDRVRDKIRRPADDFVRYV
ncbi:MAG: nitroreductase family protein [Deltaproteobacteria bacterium]|jgi:nitroreductase|nr:nitroreductase family protein [Deltaproteobacteria bacterium]